MVIYDMKYAPNVDLSDFTYKDLENLEEKIAKKKKELKETEYKGLVNDVLNAINAIIEAGYGHIDACYDDEGEPYDWKGLSYEIAQEYKRRKED